MAQKRMFSKDIVDRDKFYELPMESQLLYFHLGMNADVKGFVEIKKILRLIGIKQEACKPLLQENLVIAFQTGVIVITDWNVNNTVREEREAPTRYANELKMLELSPTNEYKLKGALHDYSRSTPAQYSVVEVSVDKIRLEEISIVENEFSTHSINPKLPEQTPTQDSMEALDKSLPSNIDVEPQHIPSQTQVPGIEVNKLNKLSIEVVASEPEGAGTRAGKEKSSAKKEKGLSIELQKMALEILEFWNQVNDQNLTSVHGFSDNLKFWIDELGIEKIKNAIRNKKSHSSSFYKDMSISTLFRRSNKSGNCSYIEDLQVSSSQITDNLKLRPTTQQIEAVKLQEKFVASQNIKLND